MDGDLNAAKLFEQSDCYYCADCFERLLDESDYPNLLKAAIRRVLDIYAGATGGNIATIRN
jgi:hypothetical protein